MSLAVALVSAGAALASAPLPAQRPPRPDSATVTLARNADRANMRPAANDERELEAVVVRAAEPRSYRLVRVDVPVEMIEMGDVSYEVVSFSSATVLGAKHGIVTRSAADHAALLTVGIPSTALAGRATVAYVRFAAGGAETVRVPVQLDVMPRYALRVTSSQPMLGGRPGDRMEPLFQISNRGNIADTVSLSLDAPEGWSARILGSAMAVIAPGETIERRGRVSVPARWDGGAYTVSLVAARHGESAGRASTLVELAGGTRTASATGPAVRLGVGSVAVGGTAPRSVENVAFDGNLSDALSIHGQLSTPVSDRPEAERALASMGYSSQANTISLAGARWTATGGATGVGLNDLAGETIFGRGGSLRVRTGGADLQVIGATQVYSSTDWTTPTLFGAIASMRVSSTTLSAFVSRLRDSSFVTRDLDAAGVGAEMNPWSGGSVSAQLAERRFRDGSGLGAATNVSGPIAGADVDVRWLHAPGGSAAFAPSQNGVSASASKNFSKIHSDVSFWSARDGTPLLSLASDGWSISPTYLAAPWLSIGVDVRRSGYSSGGATGMFSSDQTEYGGRVNLRAFGFDANGDSRYASIGREATPPGATSLLEHGRRLTNRARLDHGLIGGVIGVAGSLESAVDAAGAVPVQTLIDAHAERLAPFGRNSPLTVSGGIQRLQYGPAALTTSRFEVDLALRQGLRIVGGWERGTFRDATGATPSIATLRLERTSNLPRLGQRLASGIVFQDRNGNGVRDAGEPGVPGIVVRRGGESAVTDANGSFRFTPGANGAVEIDSRSLPEGWLQSPRTLGAGGGGGQRDGIALGVIPTSALDVVVLLSPSPEGSATAVRVGVATLTLRDSSGRTWVARTGAVQRATFDALPKGRYTLTAELDGSSEPLVVDPIPNVEIDGTPGRRQITVTVRTRPVRIFRPKA
jgi:SdrD B-like protein/alpha-galactosidase-like protein